jgi:hypothetical protein
MHAILTLAVILSVGSNAARSGAPAAASFTAMKPLVNKGGNLEKLIVDGQGVAQGREPPRKKQTPPKTATEDEVLDQEANIKAELVAKNAAERKKRERARISEFVQKEKKERKQQKQQTQTTTKVSAKEEEQAHVNNKEAGKPAQDGCSINIPIELDSPHRYSVACQWHTHLNNCCCAGLSFLARI